MTDKPKKPKTRTPRTKTFSELANAEGQYKKTRDFRLVVLAIGYHPDNIPKWAISACREYYERWELDYTTITNAKKWLMPKEDKFGSSLDEMADYILQQHLNNEKGDWETTVHKAANFIASRESQNGQVRINSVVQRLIRTWDKEAKAWTVGGPPIKDDPPTKGRRVKKGPHIADHPRIVRKYVASIKNGAFTSKKS